MSIPAHRQAAAVPTPAHSFELTKGALVAQPDPQAETIVPADTATAVPMAATEAPAPTTSEPAPSEADAPAPDAGTPAPDAPAPANRRKGA